MKITGNTSDLTAPVIVGVVVVSSFLPQLL